MEDQDQHHHSPHPQHTTQDTKEALEMKNEGSKLEFSEDEETLIARMFSLVGDRWALIAGRIPGRTAKEIEKYWTSLHNSSTETTLSQASTKL